MEAVIERPPAPRWIGELPFPVRTDWWPGTLLSWRWVDRERALWSGLVRYLREGPNYEHAVSGELIDVLPLPVADDGTRLGMNGGLTPENDEPAPPNGGDQ